MEELFTDGKQIMNGVETPPGTSENKHIRPFWRQEKQQQSVINNINNGQTLLVPHVLFLPWYVKMTSIKNIKLIDFSETVYYDMYTVCRIQYTTNSVSMLYQISDSMCALSAQS